MKGGIKSPKRVVAIGTSAGGLRALCSLMNQLPNDFAAAILVVQHLGASATGSVLAQMLQKNSSLRTKLAGDGDRLENGAVLVAPPDHHLLVKKGSVLVTKGARENRSRPAIDPLFRSAAVAYNSRVIGILLTGNLDDGTAGLAAIQACGGICIVQQP